ncbi:MAG TPA: chemotaxis protein CheB [Burkholderiaceae bacterium]|nr:chemotaxis protein CheB [Burkholderiaceae bacterium]
MTRSTALRDQPPPLAIVVGGSAGGIDALNALLPPLPAQLGIPIVVALHLPPGQPSMLASLFEPRCALPVHEASDKEPLDAGVYFAPPDYHLLIEPHRSLALSVDPPLNYSRPSIDVLFQSAAWAFGPRLLGIVLSGANQDGAAGLRAIRRAGGAAWVQSPQAAAMPTMPLAALRVAGADCVLMPDAMATRLAALAPARGR